MSVFLGGGRYDDRGGRDHRSDHRGGGGDRRDSYGGGSRNRSRSPRRDQRRDDRYDGGGRRYSIFYRGQHIRLKHLFHVAVH